MLKLLFTNVTANLFLEFLTSSFLLYVSSSYLVYSGLQKDLEHTHLVFFRSS
jgi:hypothetical protein